MKIVTVDFWRIRGLTYYSKTVTTRDISRFLKVRITKVEEDNSKEIKLCISDGRPIYEPESCGVVANLNVTSVPTKKSLELQI